MEIISSSSEQMNSKVIKRTNIIKLLRSNKKFISANARSCQGIRGYFKNTQDEYIRENLKKNEIV